MENLEIMLSTAMQSMCYVSIKTKNSRELHQIVYHGVGEFEIIQTLIIAKLFCYFSSPPTSIASVLVGEVDFKFIPTISKSKKS